MKTPPIDEYLPKLVENVIKQIAPNAIYTPNTPLHEMRIDSLDLVDMQIRLRKEIKYQYGLEISLPDIEQFATGHPQDDPNSRETKLTGSTLIHQLRESIDDKLKDTVGDVITRYVEDHLHVENYTYDPKQRLNDPENPLEKPTKPGDDSHTYFDTADITGVLINLSPRLKQIRPDISVPRELPGVNEYNQDTAEITGETFLNFARDQLGLSSPEQDAGQKPQPTSAIDPANFAHGNRKPPQRG